MAQAKEQSQTMAQAQNRNTESTGEKRPRTRRPYYQRRPRRPQQPKEAAVPIHIYPLGGLGEVGKNMTVYECCGDMIIVDCGLVFPDSDMYGVDLVIPDFTFVVQNKEKIKGLLITHGHEDHIGSIPYLLQKFDLPIYGTRLTCGLIRNKLEEFGLAGKTKFVEITPKQKLKLGCFTVEPIHVNHSIPDAVAFAIDSPAGTIIQTGDFKIDYTPLACGVTDLSTLAEYGQRGVLALLSDSTNSERPGFTATEQKVAAGVRNLFARARNKRIIIATFASNIYRVQQIIDLAVEDGRIRVFHKPNGGQSDARNVGLQQTQGKYFYLLDSDDLIRSTALAQFVEHCEADGADAALTPLEMFSTEQPEGRTENLHQIPELLNREETMRRMLLHQGIGHGAGGVFFRREVWGDLQFPVGILYEDYAVMYRAIARCAKVEVFPEPMYDYRIHTGSTMKSGIAEKNLVILDVGEDVTRFIAETVPVLKAEAEYLQLVTYLKTLKGILDGGFGSYPEAQARICRFVQEYRALARRPWAKKADRIKVETLLISKRLFYAVYGLGEWKNKHTVEK